MAAIHETAYPRFKPYFTPKELEEVFCLSLDEMALLNRKTKATNEVTRLSFAFLLKSYQYLGRFIKISEVNVGVRKYIAKQLAIDKDIDLSCYPKATRKRHKKSIREYFDIDMDKKKRRQVMKKSALETAQKKRI